MTTTMVKLHTGACRAGRRAAARLHCDRGDVPGWVLITLMTAALVVGLWAIAGEQLQSIFKEALGGVTGPDDPR